MPSEVPVANQILAVGPPRNVISLIVSRWRPSPQRSARLPATSLHAAVPSARNRCTARAPRWQTYFHRTGGQPAPGASDPVASRPRIFRGESPYMSNPAGFSTRTPFVHHLAAELAAGWMVSAISRYCGRRPLRRSAGTSLRASIFPAPRLAARPYSGLQWCPIDPSTKVGPLPFSNEWSGISRRWRRRRPSRALGAMQEPTTPPAWKPVGHPDDPVSVPPPLARRYLEHCLKLVPWLPLRDP